ncbi:MAG: gamma-glutamyltransferase [Myxococcales bacterium]|nr:gamma-glutamyltransferase [Myxococcales bacterium]
MPRQTSINLRVAVALCALWLQVKPSWSASHPPITGRAGVVAADDERASRLAAGILERGGTAIDAAITAALAVGVVNPQSSGLGGGGFAVVYIAATGRFYAFDFRETGPAAISAALFFENGALHPTRSQLGGLAVGVPGELAGLIALHREFGVLPWRDLVLPVARLADRFDVGWHAARAVADAGTPYAAAFAHWQQGGVVGRPALAKTLRALASNPMAMYRGPLARELAASVVAAGGVITEKDLADYSIVTRTPLQGQWRGLRVVTMPLPSSGGVVLLSSLGTIAASGLDLAKFGAGSATAFHVIAEVLKHGFADRSRYLGDSAASATFLAEMLQPARLARMAKRIDLKRTQPIASYGQGPAAGRGLPEDRGTSHLCVVDAAGNAIALTTTVNGYFGSGIVTPSGIVLNNQIDDFTIEAGTANLYGLVQSELNLVAPGKRPLSSMTPTLIADDKGIVGCVGGSGGPNIISATLQVLLNGLWFGMDAEAAVSAPRIHHQWAPETLRVDRDVAPEVADALRAKGHKLAGAPYGQVQAIFIRNGLMEAASDPRKGGRAAAARPGSKPKTRRP